MNPRPDQRPQAFTAPRQEPQPAVDVAALRDRARAAVTSHPAPSAPRSVDVGRIVGRSARHDGSELRVSVHEFNGHPFVRVGPWQNSSPDAYPVKGRAASLRRAELALVAAALLDALDLMERDEKASRGG